MVKFIVEVSENYIKERANLEVIAETNVDGKGSMVKALVEMIAFGSLENKVDKGEKEFTVSSKDFNEKEELSLFNSVVTQLGVLALHATVKDKEKATTK